MRGALLDASCCIRSTPDRSGRGTARAWTWNKKTPGRHVCNLKTPGVSACIAFGISEEKVFPKEAQVLGCTP